MARIKPLTDREIKDREAILKKALKAGAKAVGYMKKGPYYRDVRNEWNKQEKQFMKYYKMALRGTGSDVPIVIDGSKDRMKKFLTAFLKSLKRSLKGKRKLDLNISYKSKDIKSIRGGYKVIFGLAAFPMKQVFRKP